MIECDEIITVMDIVSTKKTNNIATKVTSTASINCQSKKVSYILQTILLAIILLLLIIIFYNHTKHRSKQKGMNALTIQNGK